MVLTLHNLKLNRRSKHRVKRLGRGNASGHGTYSGHGGKGQTARTGGSKGLKIKGMRQLLLRVPKLGGFRSPYPKPAALSWSVLAKHFDAGAEVTRQALLVKRLVPRIAVGVKIVGPAKVTKKLNLVGLKVSKSVQAAIEAAGGTVS